MSLDRRYIAVGNFAEHRGSLSASPAQRRRWWGWVIITILPATLSLCGCTATPQQREAEFLRRGKIQAAKKDYARAALDFRNAIQVMPSDAEPHYELGLVHLASAAPAEAYVEFKRAAELNPHHLGAQVQLAQLVAAGGNREMLETSRDNLNRLLRNSTSNADALDALAMIEFRLGKPDAAREILARAMQSFPDHVQSAVAMAKLEISRGQISKAEEMLRNVVARSPQLPEARLALADFYLSRQQWTPAKEQFQSVLRLKAGIDLALVGLAATDVQLGHFEEAEKIFREISLLPNRQYRGVYAKYLMTQGRYGDAVSEFERLSKTDPRDREFRDNLVIACLLADQGPKGTQILVKALQENRKDADALLLYSAVLLNLGKYDEAEQKLGEVLSAGGNLGMAHFFLSRVYRAQGRVLRQRQELAEALRANPALLGARLDLARNYLAANAPRPALDILNAAPEQQKMERSWVALRNWTLLFAGETERLGKAVEAALTMERSPDFLLQSALVKMLARDYRGARISLDQGLVLAPEDTRLLWVKAQSYAVERQSSVASTFLAEYAAKWPKSAAVRIVQGEWLASIGDYEGARKALLAARPLQQSTSSEAEFQLAILDANNDRFEEARAAFAKLLEQDGYRFRARLWLANIEDRTRDYQLAIKDYRQVLLVEGENLIALNNLAYLLATQTDQVDEAMTLAQKASELAPGNPDVEGTLGWVLFRKGLYDNAVRLLEQASHRDGSNVTDGATLRKYHLGMAYLKAGSRQRALKTLAAALEVNRNLPEAEAAQRLLLQQGAR